MENVWFKPKEYQRTSKKLQFKCLELLLNFSEIEGDILDVGCGTGNALNFLKDGNIRSYLGIDISQDMVNYARSQNDSKKCSFIVSDFLNYQDTEIKLYDSVICAACLHWFIPNEQEVINKIFHLLRPGAKFFLSCAFDFNFSLGEKDIQGEILQKVREKYRPISPLVVFDDYRFDSKKFINSTKGFDIIKSHRIEEVVNFSTYEDFRDWHLGSGSVVYQQFDKVDQENAVNEFYDLLYHKYISGEHKVSYSTGLFLLKKRG
ncbi:class I SAM-dependent methyltransferase [Photorhabdus africana]|uniref:class I SAM-dependent methyltransferase n=1 Tax=Photorhabdus africana TaxID=3097554 RepID=UPI002B405B05|nr:class I SAM-dependent methyltransferase [Photorhabdus sp. CRI-LC]